MKVRYNTVLLKFDRQGEKTGWTYIEIPVELASRLLPWNKRSFRVKGKLDACIIRQASLLPMGNGNFILPVNGAMRKKLGKKQGATVSVELELDKQPFKLSSDLMSCLSDDQAALDFFNELKPSHQKYFSNWIESAKTAPTKAKRIAQAMNAFSRQLGFSEMMRSLKNDKDRLLS